MIRLRVMIIMARPQAMTRLTATTWPFIRPRSRRSFLSRGGSMASPLQLACGESDFVCALLNDLSVFQVKDSVSHFGHRRIVRDDES